jgi:hypothetical protein
MIRPTISIPSGNRRPAPILRACKGITSEFWPDSKRGKAELIPLQGLRIHKRISSRTSNRFPHEIRHKCRKLFIYGSLIPLVYLLRSAARFEVCQTKVWTPICILPNLFETLPFHLNLFPSISVYIVDNF